MKLLTKSIGLLLCMVLLLGWLLLLLAGLLTAGRLSPLRLGAYPGADGSAIVRQALQMAAHLHNCPPDNLDQCWDSGFPSQAIHFWAQECPGCLAASNGHLQCVMFAVAAYGLAGDPLPVVSNAVDFWSNYRAPQLRAKGWIEVANGTGIPLPGDMVIMSSPYFGGVGHMAIVINVKLPVNGGSGLLSLAQANGPGPINSFPLTDLRLHTWPNYTVLGFIRHVHSLPAGGLHRSDQA